jgi:hypothetical protein
VKCWWRGGAKGPSLTARDVARRRGMQVSWYGGGSLGNTRRLTHVFDHRTRKWWRYGAPRERVRSAEKWASLAKPGDRVLG